MDKTRAERILALPMQQPNDADAATVGEYLAALLEELIRNGECFSGKRPFGNSGWEWDPMLPLVKAGVVAGEIRKDEGYPEYLLDVNEDDARRVLTDAVRAVSGPGMDSRQEGARNDG